MSDYDITTDEQGHIKNGLRADIMRCCMENKNLLAEEGSIYIGTGEKIVITGAGGRITIAKTEALNPGNYGEILMVDGSNLCYSKLSEANFDCNSNNIVQGDVGSSTYPAKEACNVYKENLYRQSSEYFSGDSFSMSFDSTWFTTQAPFKGYLSITNHLGYNIDFGFLFFPSLVSGKKVILYPVNLGDFYIVPDDSQLGDKHLLYLIVEVQSISVSQLRLSVRIRGGDSAMSQFRSSSPSHYLFKLIPLEMGV